MHRSLIAGLVASLAALSFAPAALAVAEPDVPSTIEVPRGHKLFKVAHATGVQIYTCNAGAWALTAPRADLVNQKGKKVMIHYAGPTWEFKDGSKVMAARVDGVTVDPTAIPWLLLKATSTAAGAFGDKLVPTTYIQRIATTGGLAPAPSACTTNGTVAEISYTADYYFYQAK